LRQGYLSGLVLDQVRSLESGMSLKRINGSFMFVDLSGFTAMSDKLSASGRLGSEELAAVINNVFDPLLEIIFSYSGDAVKFGGDAVLTLFKGKNHTKRAVECGNALLAEIGTSYKVQTSAGVFPISIHIGVSRGGAISAIVGKRGKRHDHLFCGPDVSAAYAAADIAESGELCITENCLPFLPKLSLIKKGDYFVLRESLRLRSLPRAPREKAHKISFSKIRRFLIPGVWEITAGTSRDRIDGAHRPITAMFMAIDGWHENLRSAKNVEHRNFKKINDHIAGLFAVVEKYGGNIVRLDVTDGGERALALFGAPVLRENAPDDALKAALEIIKSAEEYSRLTAIPLRIRIGVNSGVCYVGDVGGSYRREYTAIGKEVNLAARMMSKAEWGEIIAGPSVLKAVRGQVKTAEKGKYRLKGIAQPIALKAVIEISEEPEYVPSAANLVGREDETAALESFAAMSAVGQSAMVQIFGEAGSGKSVLMEIAAKRLLEKSVAVLKAACFQHTSNIPLYPIGDILRKMIGIAEGDDRIVRRRKLVSVLEGIGEVEWEGLLSRLAGYRSRPTPEIIHLSENAKRDRTFQLIDHLLRSYFTGQYGCLIIDDLHWGDATTIEYIYKRGAWLIGGNISLLLAARVSEAVPRYDKAIIIDLGPLDERSSARLFESTVGRQVPREFVAEIVKASGGNPFFLEEMAKAVRDMGIESWSEGAGVPDRVERVITARIDRLEKMVQTTVRTASVIGRVFGIEDLTGIFPIKEKRKLIPSYLKKSAELDITPIERVEPIIEYGFKHILTREVAYSGLSFKTRRALHLSLAEFYRKKRLIRGIEPELIGYHYEHSEIPRLAAPYYLRAGYSDARAFSNSEAIFNFSRVLSLLESDDNENMKRRAHLGLGRVYKLIGEYEKSESHLRQARDLSPVGMTWRTEALKGLSELFRIKSDFEKASGVLSELLAIAGDNPDLGAIYQNSLGDIARRRGDLEPALAHFDEAIIQGDKIDPDLRAQILNNMGISLWMLGRLDEALSAYNNASEIYKKNRDLQGMAKISNNAGIIHEQKGDLYQAAEHYRAAADVFQKIGDRRSQGYCYGNLATNFIVRGLPYQGKYYIDRAFELFEMIGDREAGAMTVGNLSDWYYLMGDSDSERRLINSALESSVRLRNDELICENKIRMGRFRIGEDVAESLNHLKNAQAESVERKWHDLEVKSEYHLREWETLSGDGRDADILLDRLANLRRKSPPPEILCGIDKLAGLIRYKTGDRAAARASLTDAYRTALKSDLVYDRWEISALFGTLYPENSRNGLRRENILRQRIFQGLDEKAASGLKARFGRRIDIYLSKAAAAVKPFMTAR